MAGLGRKVWTNETLSVPDLQGYLQDQTVQVFTSAADRASRVPAPTDGMVSYLDDTDRGYVRAAGAWVWAFGLPEPPAPIAWPAAAGWGVVGGYVAPGLYRDVSGRVCGSSAVAATGAIGNGATIATMPAGWRPDGLIPLQIPASTASGQQRLDVATTGLVTAVGGIASGVVLFLENFQFNPNTMA